MRDPVFEAQFRTMKDSFASRGVQIEVAYQPNGEVDYLYEVDRLLARNDTVERLRRLLPGLRRAEPTDREDHEDRDDREDQDGDQPVRARDRPPRGWSAPGAGCIAPAG